MNALCWQMVRLRYRRNGIALDGRADDDVWVLAFGSNMFHSVLTVRRGIRPKEWRVGRLKDHCLRFNLDGRPVGRSAPANIAPASGAEVWGVLYRMTRADLVRLDSTEGVPGRGRYRHHWVDVEDSDATPLRAVTYMADGKDTDGRPSLRYLTLLRDGARHHGLPDHYIRFLDGVRHFE